MIGTGLTLWNSILSPATVSNLVQNGNGDNAAGWSAARDGETVSSVSGRIRVTSDDGTTMGVVQSISGLTADADYQIDIEAFNGPTGSNTILIRFQNFSSLEGASSLAVSGAGADVSYSGVETAVAETMYLGIIVTGASAGEYAEIDNISVVPV